MLFFHTLLTIAPFVLFSGSETIILTPKDFSKIKIRFDFAQPDESQERAKSESSPVKG